MVITLCILMTADSVMVWWFNFQDFWEMFTHHCATICLLTFSWCGNFVRVGTLVLCIHDAVDYWLEVREMVTQVNSPKNAPNIN